MSCVIKCDSCGEFYSTDQLVSHKCKDVGDKYLSSLELGTRLNDWSHLEKLEAEVTSPTTAYDIPYDPYGMSARYNEGKIQTREIDPAFILGIGEVLTKSRAKYEHFNWCKPTKLSTPYESLMRHLMAFQSGENVDKETQSHHLLHAATNLMFMYYHIINNPEESDDRFFKKDKK